MSVFSAACMTCGQLAGLRAHDVVRVAVSRSGTARCIELSLNLLPQPPARTQGTCNLSTMPTMGTLRFSNVGVDRLTQRRFLPGNSFSASARVMMSARRQRQSR